MFSAFHDSQPTEQFSFCILNIVPNLAISYTEIALNI